MIVCSCNGLSEQADRRRGPQRAVPRKVKSNLRLPRLPSAVRPVRGCHQANPRRRPSIALSDFASKPFVRTLPAQPNACLQELKLAAVVCPVEKSLALAPAAG